jgi:hypothetical protein
MCFIFLLDRARNYESKKICFTLIGVVILFRQFLEYFCIMEYQNKFEKGNLNKSSLLGRMRPTAELRRWTQPCGGLPSWPTLKRSPTWHGPAGWRSRRAERVRPAPARMESVWRRGYRAVDGGRGTPASLHRAWAPPRTLAGHLDDGEELTRQWSVGSGYGLTGGEVGLRDTTLPSLPVWRGNDQRGGA